MKLKAYPAYKSDSKTWTASLPSHWRSLRLKWLLDEIDERAGNQELQLLGLSKQLGVVSRDEIEQSVSESSDYGKYKIARAGDIVMNKMQAWNGVFGISPQDGIVSPDYSVFRCTERPLTQFLSLLFRTNLAAGEFFKKCRGMGTAFLRLNSGDFLDSWIAAPPPGEEREILSFLDHETAKIDALNAEQQRMIELLQEKRQALISHAVTKGLNPNVPMKDSGVEWLGEVPEHWEVGPIKRFLSSMNYKRVPLSAEERSSRQGNYPYYGASGIIDAVDDFLFDESLVLVSEDGANLLMRSTPIAFEAHGEYWVNNHAHILRPNDGLTLFWSERIESLQIAPFVTGSAQPKLTAEALLNLTVSCPLEEQEKKAIEARIQAARLELEPLIEAAEDTVRLLGERRSALISAAVTGQIDVRGLVLEEAP